MHLVTGGAGFLGSHLVEALVASGEPTRVLDVAALDLPEIEAAVDVVQGDIRDPAVVARACEGVRVIHHTAALVPLAKAGPGFVDVNVEGTRTLYTAALRAGVHRVVHVSSSAVYGVPRELPVTETSPVAPLGPYGRAKYQAEELCDRYRQRGLEITIVRPRTIVGGRRLGIFHILYDWIRRGRRIYLLGTGDNQLQLLSARDAAAGCLLAGTRGGNTVYNLGAAQYGTLRHDLERLIAHAGTGSRVVPIPAAPARTALRLLDWLRLSPLADWHYLTLDKPFYVDLTKVKRELGWEPRDSNVEMLIESYDWYLQHRAVIEREAAGTRHRLPPRQRLLRLLGRVS